MTSYEYEVLNEARMPTTDGGLLVGTPIAPRYWNSFKESIRGYQDDCGADQAIKVILLARHGQAMHNYMADQTGLSMYEIQRLHGTPDPSLSPLGIQQCQRLARKLHGEVERGMPVPERWFVSTLRRTGETCQLHWDWLFYSPFKTQRACPTSDASDTRGPGVPVTVTENLREILHVQPCNARSSLTDLEKMFPSFIFPETLAEEDEMWNSESQRGRETSDELTARAIAALRECIELSEGATYVSITSHSKIIRALLEVLGVNDCRMELGDMRILVLRASAH